MAALKEASALLPNGQYFDNWETVQTYDRELHVNCNHRRHAIETMALQSIPS